MARSIIKAIVKTNPRKKAPKRRKSVAKRKNPIVIAHKKDVIGRVFELSSLKPSVKGHTRTMVKIKASNGKVYKGLIRAKDWNNRYPEMGSYAKLTRSGFL